MNKGKVLDVYYKNRHVGTLAETADRRIAFQYDREWIRTGFSISPISLPLSNEVFVPGEKSTERFGGLFGIFGLSSFRQKPIRTSVANGNTIILCAQKNVESI